MRRPVHMRTSPLANSPSHRRAPSDNAAMTAPEHSLTVTFQVAGSDEKVGELAAGTVTGAVAGFALGVGPGGGDLGSAIGNKLTKKITVPYFAADGVEHAGAWNAPTQVEARPGAHHVEVYTKLKKGLKPKQRKGRIDFTLSAGDSARMHVNFVDVLPAVELRGFLVPTGCLVVHAASNAVGRLVVEVRAERLCRIAILALRLALMRATDLREGGCLRPRRLRANAQRLDFGDSSTS
jgi:hypothetical protein